MCIPVQRKFTDP